MHILRAQNVALYLYVCTIKLMKYMPERVFYTLCMHYRMDAYDRVLFNAAYIGAFFMYMYFIFSSVSLSFLFGFFFLLLISYHFLFDF